MFRMHEREKHDGKYFSIHELRTLQLKKRIPMDVEKVLNYTCGWNYYTMRVMGIWPNERKWNKPSSYLALVPILMMFCFVTAPQTIHLSFIWGDFNLMVENLSMANITITISLLKTIAFCLNNKPLKSLLQDMADDWRATTKSSEREKLLVFAKSIRKTIRISTVMSHAVVYTYTTLRYLAVKYTGTKLLFRGYFPYNTDVCPIYELTVIGQFLAALYSASSYTAVDTFICMLILHICGQLSNLREKLQDIHRCDKKDLHAQLVKIVKKHEHLNRFAETIETCFNMMLLIQMVGSTIQLCFQGFQAFMPLSSEAKEVFAFQVLFLTLYVVYVMLQLYMYCYVGEKLSVESAELASAAYNSEWYNLVPKNAKLLIIIMCRARVPLRITAGKFCFFTTVLYSQILKTSLGYISVLYAMKDK